MKGEKDNQEALQRSSWKKTVGWVLVFVFVVSGAMFLRYSYDRFVVSRDFKPIPLSFNPEGSVSQFDWNGASVTVKGGFVKGTMKYNSQENLLVRSLSPSIKIEVNNSQGNAGKLGIMIENISTANTDISGVAKEAQVQVDEHTVLLNIDMSGQTKKAVSANAKGGSDGFEIVILGDNRNGYQTFSSIIQQINYINPVFAVDNGDLVFGGEPNKYRLFYETVLKLKVPLYTTLGNHDIREGGRGEYTRLFGPPYYSFDYGGVHFIFLDSSRGWTEKIAIPKEQYEWLEKDLKANEGKRIFVVSHTPPTDPRKLTDPNTLPEMKNAGLIEKLMYDYSRYKSLNHGFPTREEAEKFEALMTKYKVDTVFLSHIHSYISFVKGGVRYVISGGAGAELLTTDSYYHYTRVKITKDDVLLEVVELPSPTNTIQDRYIAAAQLFAKSIYKEYKLEILLLVLLLTVAVGWLLYVTKKKWMAALKFAAAWLLKVIRYGYEEFRNMRR